MRNPEVVHGWRVRDDDLVRGNHGAGVSGGGTEDAMLDTLLIFHLLASMDVQFTLIRELKPGMKNLKLVFIVLEIVRTIQRVTRDKLHYRKVEVKARTEPHVNETQRKRRCDFAKNHRDWDLVDWRKVLWTDEATFSISDTRGTEVWCHSGTSTCDPHCTVKVWGAFGYGGLADLVFLPKGQTLSSNTYISSLRFCMQFSEQPNMSEPNPELVPLSKGTCGPGGGGDQGSGGGNRGGSQGGGNSGSGPLGDASRDPRLFKPNSNGGNTDPRGGKGGGGGGGGGVTASNGHHNSSSGRHTNSSSKSRSHGPGKSSAKRSHEKNNKWNINSKTTRTKSPNDERCLVGLSVCDLYCFPNTTRQDHHQDKIPPTPHCAGRLLVMP
ncbi:hypothetical protein E2C01_029314 [Portunus trituberculatus]|uniref:Transposable element Tc1 transposase n=1 Tax=Portunus trituberculatus TaxID=210409 RepID=A0A5B7ERJ6_PORTR|nr:hypothetical protein [Portunus trituberculatus]